MIGGDQNKKYFLYMGEDISFIFKFICYDIVNI